MDRIDAMKTLLTAIDEGSLSAASRKLGTPLATVSRKVSELEAHLRARILVRTSRKLMLTEAGDAYVAACRRILEEIDDAERAAASEYRVPRGHLTITASVMLGQIHVEPVVLDFLQAYPDITVRLALSDALANIVDDHIDVAIRVGPLPDSTMMAQRLGETAWIACASPDYLARRGIPQRPEDLANHDCILFEGHSSALWSSETLRFVKSGKPVGVAITPRLRVNTAAAALSAAIAGAGVVRVLRYQAIPALASGALRTVLERYEPAPIPVHMLHAGAQPLPLKLRAFLDFAAPRLRASLKA